LIYKSRL